MSNPLVLYLAGAIRDNEEQDIVWREHTAMALMPFIQQGLLRIISPLGGKQFNAKTGKWTISGEETSAAHIVAQDFWAIDRADLAVFNLLSLAQGYPSIGTLMELGRATGRSTLRYIIAPPAFQGHANKGTFAGLHPFVERNASMCFESVERWLNFMMRHMPVLAGVDPRFNPPREKDVLELLTLDKFFNA